MVLLNLILYVDVVFEDAVAVVAVAGVAAAAVDFDFVQFGLLALVAVVVRVAVCLLVRKMQK